MFLRAPVKKLSTHKTWYPRAISRSHRWDPRKPAPPVTNTRCSKCIYHLPRRRRRLSARSCKSPAALIAANRAGKSINVCPGCFPHAAARGPAALKSVSGGCQLSPAEPGRWLAPTAQRARTPCPLSTAPNRGMAVSEPSEGPQQSPSDPQQDQWRQKGHAYRAQ